MRKKLLSLLLGVVMTAVPFTPVSAEELTDGNAGEDLTSEAGELSETPLPGIQGKASETATLCPGQVYEASIQVIGEGDLSVSSSSDKISVKYTGCTRLQIGSYVKYVYGYDISCPEEGSYTVTFTHPSGQKLDYSLNVKPHDLKKIKTVEPTCTVSGYTEYKCSRCEKTEKGDIVEAKGHVWGKEYVVDKEASCAQKGQKSIHCTVCDEVQKESIIEIPALEHKYETTVKKADFIEDGSIVTACSVCGDKKENTVIPHVAEVRLSHTEFRYNGANRQPKVTLYDRAGRELSSDNYSVVYPKESKRPGEYALTVTLSGENYEGSTSADYTVRKADQTIALEDAVKRIDSKTFTLKAKITQGNKSGRFGYKSDNPEVASVTSWGKITFHKVGKVNITATTNGNGNYNSASKTVTITIVPTPTAITKLQSVKPGCINIQYRGNKDVDGYQIQCALTPDMKGAKSYAVKNPAVRSYSRTDAKSGEKYYVRVRTYKMADGERIYSNWSGVKSVVIK